MSRDLDQLLYDTAATPAQRPDPADLVRRGRRRRRRRHMTGVASAVAAAGLLGVVGLQAWPTAPTPEIMDQPEDAGRPTTPASPGDQDTDALPAEEGTDDVAVAHAQRLEWPEGPSQSPEDAAAQGVPPEVAALPLADRLELRGGTQAPEGLYVTSGVPWDVAESIAGGDGRLSDGTGVSEYEELLLLDPATLTIQRAWPTAGLSFHEAPTVLDDPNIVFVGRGGDGGEPWTGVIVLDRETGERRGHVSVPDEVETDSVWQDADWVTVNPPHQLPTTILGTVDGLLAAPAEDGTVALHDPVTLEVVDQIARADGHVTGLAPAGPGTIVERSAAPARFLELTTPEITPRGDIPVFPGNVVAADTGATPLVVSFDEGQRLWRLQDATWIEVFDGGAYELRLHRTAAATWATGYDWRTGGVLFRNGQRVAQRSFDRSGGEVGRGGDVVASRPDGTVLWFSRDVPYLVSPTPTPDADVAATPATPTLWEGARRLDDGDVDDEGFSTYLQSRPEVAMDPAAVAALLFGVSLDEVDVTTDVDDGEATVVLISDTSNFDDSVAAVRYEVLLAADGDVWMVREAGWSQSCRDGRGHSEYTAEPCL